MKHKEKYLNVGTESQGIHKICLRWIAITAVKQEDKRGHTQKYRFLDHSLEHCT